MYYVCVHIIVIVNLKLLQRPQKRSRGNQLIHRRLTKTKSIGRQRVKLQRGRQAGSQMAMVDGVWSWNSEDILNVWIYIYPLGDCLKLQLTGTNQLTADARSLVLLREKCQLPGCHDDWLKAPIYSSNRWLTSPLPTPFTPSPTRVWLIGRLALTTGRQASVRQLTTTAQWLWGWRKEGG